MSSLLSMTSETAASTSTSTSICEGQKFMINLLVSSLMEDGGLESAILAAVKVEVADLEESAFKVSTSSFNLN